MKTAQTHVGLPPSKLRTAVWNLPDSVPRFPSIGGDRPANLEEKKLLLKTGCAAKGGISINGWN
jgi:hypothetical protein